jgi:hypothetical protein
MPCNQDEVNMNAPEAVPPCTPLKPTGNGGAGRVDQEGKMNSDSEEMEWQRIMDNDQALGDW